VVSQNPYKLNVTLPSERQIRLTREFDFPRELVFQAMMSPEHIQSWWGPRGSNMKIDTMDVRPGGKWRFVEHAQDGSEFGFRGEYREIDPPGRAVQTFEWEGMPGHISVETLILEDLGGRTRLTVTSEFDSVEDRDGMLQSGMEQGAGESYDRLSEYLATLQA
jgi:uncharacterized protein YndB with AHSA1/START domain